MQTLYCKLLNSSQFGLLQLLLKHSTTIVAPSTVNPMSAARTLYVTSCSSVVLGFTPQFIPASTPRCLWISTSCSGPSVFFQILECLEIRLKFKPEGFVCFANQTEFFVSLLTFHETTGLYVNLSSCIIGKFFVSTKRMFSLGLKFWAD